MSMILQVLLFEVQHMRSIRLIVPAAAAVLALGLAPASGSAQGASVFQNSWYWGLYGGQTSFATVIARTNAPTIGADWMITRERFALNVFAEQSYFNAVSTIKDFPTSAQRRVDLTDMRRVGFSGMIFTPQLGPIKPYVGFGYAFHFVKTATPQAQTSGAVYYASPEARDSVSKRIDRARTQGKGFADLGFMYNWRRFSPFVQYTIMPTQGSSSWFVNGTGFTNIWALGLRYNLGTSIEKNW